MVITLKFAKVIDIVTLVRYYVRIFIPQIWGIEYFFKVDINNLLISELSSLEI